MKKLTYIEYLELLANEETSDAEIAKVSMVLRGQGPFDFRIVPNPEFVDVPDTLVDTESGLGIANGIFRWRRKRKFKSRLRSKPEMPVIVSEGDSWFQFPLLLTETIDHLSKDYNVLSLGAAGDTADNMLGHSLGKRKNEYLANLRDYKQQVKAFLFSGAGNDILGEDPEDNVPVLKKLLNPYDSTVVDVRDHINDAEFNRRKKFLKDAYVGMIETIRMDGFVALPILIHCYDYVFPFDGKGNDPRSPSSLLGEPDQYLGKPLSERGYSDFALGRRILRVMIDDVYEIFDEIAGIFSNVHVIDCRDALPNVESWYDEIHGTSNGFAEVARRFDRTLREVVKRSPEV